MIVTVSSVPPFTFCTTFDGVPVPQGGPPLPPFSVVTYDFGVTIMKCALAARGSHSVSPARARAKVRACIFDLRSAEKGPWGGVEGVLYPISPPDQAPS